jgi:hypothetical protein
MKGWDAVEGDGLIPRPSSPAVCVKEKKDYQTEEDARAQQRAVGPLMNERNHYGL